MFLQSQKPLLGLIVYSHLERPPRMARGRPSVTHPKSANSISRCLPGEAWTHGPFSSPFPLQTKPPTVSAVAPFLLHVTAVTWAPGPYPFSEWHAGLIQPYLPPFIGPHTPVYQDCTLPAPCPRDIFTACPFAWHAFSLCIPLSSGQSHSMVFLCCHLSPAWPCTGPGPCIVGAP